MKIISKNANRSNVVSKRRITGQGMTEYIIVVALVALAAVTAVGFFGDTIQSQFAAMSGQLTGNAATTATARQEGATAATAAQGTITPTEGLADY